MATNHEVGSSILSGRTILPTCSALRTDFPGETEEKGHEKHSLGRVFVGAGASGN